MFLFGHGEVPVTNPHQMIANQEGIKLSVPRRIIAEVKFESQLRSGTDGQKSVRGFEGNPVGNR